MLVIININGFIETCAHEMFVIHQIYDRCYSCCMHRKLGNNFIVFFKSVPKHNQGIPIIASDPNILPINMS